MLVKELQTHAQCHMTMSHVCGKVTRLLLLTAGCATFYLIQHMPHSYGELSEQLQSEFDLPLIHTSLFRNVTSEPEKQQRPEGRSSRVRRRWGAWKKQKREGSCQVFNVLFDHAPRHGCIVAENTAIPFCQMQQLRIDVSKINSPKGGEDLKSVMGRDEDVEYPKYGPGALTISKPLEGIPAMLERPTFHYIRDVLSSVEQQELPCVETWKSPTLFITRYEYVNLYHTMTDYFNAFFSYPKEDNANNNNDDVNNVSVVFLDAHAKGNLDSVWQQVFGKINFVKHLPEGGVCFQRAIFIPPGYVSPLYPKPHRSVCPNPIMMEDFCNHFLTSYNLESVQMQRGNIVIIDRVPYIAHPRSKPHQAQRTVNNMKHLTAHLLKVPGVESVSVVHFEELSFSEQLKVVREAHVLIGNHGAGLTHLVFMSDGSHVVEFDGRLPFFTTLSRWKPSVQHHVIRSVSGHISDDYIQRILIPTIKQILS